LIAGIQRQHDGRHVVARVAVRHVTADGAQVSDLRIRDLQRRLAQDGAHRREVRRGDELGLRAHGTERDRGVVDVNAAQRADTLQVHEVSRLRHAQLHHRDQAVSPGHDQGFLAQLSEQLHRFGHVGGAMVFERGRDHARAPPLMTATCSRCSGPLWSCLAAGRGRVILHPRDTYSRRPSAALHHDDFARRDHRGPAGLRRGRARAVTEDKRLVCENALRASAAVAIGHAPARRYELPRSDPDGRRSRWRRRS
jgi:hypothetical protein